MTQSVAPLRHDRKQQNEHARPQIPVLGAWSFNEASFLYLCWSHDVGHHGHRYPQGSSHWWKTEPPTHWVLVQVSDLFQHDLLDSSQGSHGSRSLKALPVWSSVLIDFVWIHAVWSPGSGNVCAGNTTDLRPKEPPNEIPTRNVTKTFSLVWPHFTCGNLSPTDGMAGRGTAWLGGLWMSSENIRKTCHSFLVIDNHHSL